MGDIVIIQWVDSHGILIMIIWIVISTSVGYLPSPTKDSKPFYKFIFQVSNSLVFQFARAFKSKIENSPNWQDAIDKHISNGGTVINNTQNPLFLGSDKK